MPRQVTIDDLAESMGLLRVLTESGHAEYRQFVLRVLQATIERYLQQTGEEVKGRGKEREEWEKQNPPTTDTARRMREFNRKWRKQKEDWEKEYRREQEAWAAVEKVFTQMGPENLPELLRILREVEAAVKDGVMIGTISVKP